jgi:DsbC/DsbD-like thiol-disulfide interchange protein
MATSVVVLTPVVRVSSFVLRCAATCGVLAVLASPVSAAAGSPSFAAASWEQSVPIGGARAPKEPDTAEELVKVAAGVIGNAAPKGTVRVSATFNIHPGWHIYWVNSGDSGMPTQLAIDLPAGCELVASDAGKPRIDFPVPQIFSKGETTFGYERNVTLSFEVRLPEMIPSEGLPAQLKARWLVCKEACLMGQAEIALDLARPVASDAPLAKATAEALTRVPAPLPSDWRVEIAPVSSEEATFTVEAPSGTIGEGETFRFLPFETPGVRLAGRSTAESAGSLLRAQIAVAPENALGGALEVAGILVVGKNRVAYTFRKPIVLAAEGR